MLNPTGKEIAMKKIRRISYECVDGNHHLCNRKQKRWTGNSQGEVRVFKQICTCTCHKKGRKKR